MSVNYGFSLCSILHTVRNRPHNHSAVARLTSWFLRHCSRSHLPGVPASVGDSPEPRLIKALLPPREGDGLYHFTEILQQV
jgi:hypothetical protein